MTSNFQIAAVVVTFNRKQLLLECLHGLLAQTTPLQRIYIVDNASTDGTQEALEKAGYLKNPVFEYVLLASNTGGAGGFSVGVKKAYQAGYDWVWLMDDDVEPVPNGLAALLSYSDRSGCIHGRRCYSDGTQFAWGEIFDPERIRLKPLSSPPFSDGSTIHSMNVGCFEGMLLSRSVISQIGAPDPDFFIMLDDTYYGYLASKVTSVLYIDALVLVRKRRIDRTRSSIWGERPVLGSLALYYFQRNRFLIASKLNIRSVGFIRSSFSLLFRSLLRELLITQSVRRAGIVVRGFFAGVSLHFRDRGSLDVI